MHAYTHHIGDFNTATLHLSRLERSIYRDALEFYYVNECGLDASDFGLLARRLRCDTPEEKAALQFVLDEFFDLDIESAQYVQPRCERELADYRAAVAASGAVKANVNKRQQRHRDDRKQMYAALRKAGQVLPWNAKVAEVRAAYAKLKAQQDLSRTSHAPVTANHSPFPIPLNQEIPPNPPAGGAGAGQAAPIDDQQAGRQPAVKGQQMENPAAVVAQLMACFPEQRRTQVQLVGRKVVELVEGGVVTAEQLLTAAKAQSALLNKDDGKACPRVMRWLREERWLDAAVTVTGGVTGGVTGVTGVTGVDANWRSGRAGVEAMGIHLGLGPWDEGRERLFSAYEQRVVAAFDERMRSPVDGGVYAH